MDMKDGWKSLLLIEYYKNKFTCEILDGLIQDDRYWVVDDIIYYKNHIYLVLESQIKEKVMQSTHSSPLEGHPGYLKTIGKLGRGCWKM